MNKYSLLIVIVVLVAGAFVVFSLGVISAKPSVDSGRAFVDSYECAKCAKCAKCVIKQDPDVLDGLTRWRGEVTEQPADAPIVWGDTEGGHAASGW
jgi:hypothetical protein